MRVYPFISGIFFLALVYACQPERLYIENSDARLEFTTDTVFFDTVFTTIATTTQSFRIRNPHNRFIRIDEIELAKGMRSVFRINIDGMPGTRFEDIEIAPRDSMFVFVEATLDPNESNDILRIQDSIVFITNGNKQDIDLVAWGQDVHLITEGEIIGDVTWIADKPYLVKDYLIVDSLSTLRMEAGVKVHLHRNASIAVAGTLEVVGSLDEPVRFLGDRLEEDYSDIPGQWGYIYFYRSSHDNIIEYAEILNGTIGVLISATPESGMQPDLVIRNSMIHNMSSHGIYALNARVEASNVVIGSCGGASTQLDFGGYYDFIHCTLYNDWSSRYSNRTLPALYLRDYFITLNDNEDAYEVITGGDFEQASFRNSIVYGNELYELLIHSFDGRQLNYNFDHCLMKINEDSIDYLNDPLFSNIINMENPRLYAFPDTCYLDSLSPAIDAGLPAHAIGVPFDFEGFSRLDDDAPDLGAYEYRSN